MTWRAVSARPIARHVIQRMCNPRCMRLLASWGVASNIYSSRPYPPGATHDSASAIPRMAAASPAVNSIPPAPATPSATCVAIAPHARVKQTLLSTSSNNFLKHRCYNETAAHDMAYCSPRHPTHFEPSLPQ